MVSRSRGGKVFELLGRLGNRARGVNATGRKADCGCYQVRQNTNDDDASLVVSRDCSVLVGFVRGVV